MTLLRRLLLLSLFLLATAVGCNTTEDTTSVVVGVTSDFPAGTDLTSLEVEMTVDGAVTSTDEVTLGSGTTEFPAEFAFDDVPVGSTVALTLRGKLDGQLVVVRRVQTTTQAGPRRLVRIHLERFCQRLDDGTGTVGPTCDEPATTCISGVCRSPEVPLEQQEAYDPTWPDQGDDPCKTGGAPELVVGEGQSDFFSAEDSMVAQVEAGPQGGHHIWIAARVRNVNRSQTRTTVGAEFPGLGLSISPLSVIFTLDLDEGGFCKIFGLRLWLDIDGDPIADMLGEPVDVTVTMEDTDQAVATGTHRFVLSNDIL